MFIFNASHSSKITEIAKNMMYYTQSLIIHVHVDPIEVVMKCADVRFMLSKNMLVFHVFCVHEFESLRWLERAGNSKRI